MAAPRPHADAPAEREANPRAVPRQVMSLLTAGNLASWDGSGDATALDRLALTLGEPGQFSGGSDDQVRHRRSPVQAAISEHNLNFHRPVLDQRRQVLHRHRRKRRLPQPSPQVRTGPGRNPISSLVTVVTRTNPRSTREAHCAASGPTPSRTSADLSASQAVPPRLIHDIAIGQVREYLAEPARSDVLTTASGAAASCASRRRTYSLRDKPSRLARASTAASTSSGTSRISRSVTATSSAISCDSTRVSDPSQPYCRSHDSPAEQSRGARRGLDRARSLLGHEARGVDANGHYRRVLRRYLVRDAVGNLGLEPSAGCRAVNHLGLTGSDLLRG
jgi:hypothetical protein